MKVAISIVSFNTLDLTKKCLQTIFDKEWKTKVEVWVLDNDSKDDSVSMIKREFPRVKLVENSSNVGFGRGHNIILKEALADYYLVLNSDTEVLEGVIDGMVTFMEEYPDCGVSSCKILGFDGKLQPNAGDLPLGMALFNWLFHLKVLGKKSFHRNEPEYYENTREVGWVSGNFMMIRSSVLKKVGYFSSDYFMYFEDSEFCFRVKKANFKIMMNPEVSVKHLSGGSLDDPHFRQWSGEFKGLFTFYKSYFGFPASLGIRMLCYIALILRIIAFAVMRNFKVSQTYGKVIVNI